MQSACDGEECDFRGGARYETRYRRGLEGLLIQMCSEGREDTFIARQLRLMVGGARHTVRFALLVYPPLTLNERNAQTTGIEMEVA